MSEERPKGMELKAASVGIFVDYESPLARRVAGAVWSGLSRAALDSGRARISASWESLTRDPARTAQTDLRLFAIGQDRPFVIDALSALAGPPEDGAYGLVVAVPESPNPLAGPLLYQGLEELKNGGVRAGLVEPAVLRASPSECDSYARKLLGRL